MSVRSRWVYSVLLMAVWAMTGCQHARTREAASALEFETAMQINAEQEFHVSLGVRNAGEKAFAGDQAFDGRMEMRYTDGEQAGDPRAGAHIVPLRALEPDETAWPLVWRGQLEPGAYVLTWGAEGYGSTEVTFQVVERDNRLYLQE